MRKMLIAAVALALAAASARAFSLTSPDIKPDAKIGDEQVFDSFGCTGKNVSPALNWTDPPTGTKGYALMVYDPDAPTGSGFWHWVMFDIPADVTGLTKGAGDPKSGYAPKGPIQGHNDFGFAGYGGPCPPPGAEPHHYHFMLFALDTQKLDADENATAAVVGFNVHFHTLGKAELVGVYNH